MRLEVNADKSGVNYPWTSKFSGFTFTNSVEQPLIRLHWKTVPEGRGPRTYGA
jgi:hypothetical protein